MSGLLDPRLRNSLGSTVGLDELRVRRRHEVEPPRAILWCTESGKVNMPMATTSTGTLLHHISHWFNTETMYGCTRGDANQ